MYEDNNEIIMIRESIQELINISEKNTSQEMWTRFSVVQVHMFVVTSLRPALLSTWIDSYPIMGK